MPRNHPEARYVYMTRRGRDACVSFYHHLSHQAVEDGGYTGNLEQFIADCEPRKAAVARLAANPTACGRVSSFGR
eukprot:7382241-Prymnesium_polylepis.2